MDSRSPRCLAVRLGLSPSWRETDIQVAKFPAVNRHTLKTALSIANRRPTSISTSSVLTAGAILTTVVDISTQPISPQAFVPMRLKWPPCYPLKYSAHPAPLNRCKSDAARIDLQIPPVKYRFRVVLSSYWMQILGVLISVCFSSLS